VMERSVIVERGRILTALVELVQTASEREIAEIAATERHGDGTGDPLARHVKALREVIFEQSGVLTEDQYWFPSEAVELTAYAPGAPGRTFALSTAILLINELGDHQSFAMDERWSRFGRDYLNVEEPFRTPLLLGIRWLSENDEGWDVDENALPVPTRAEIQDM